jgi:RHS repeat-associated protein
MRYFPYTFFTALLLAFAALGQTDPSNENYVLQTNYQVPYSQSQVEDPNLAIPNDDKIESITYYDGLGRPKQRVAIRGGGGREDLVTPVMYDPLGRQPREYLPLPLAGNNGAFNDNSGVSGVTSGLSTYYGDKFPDDFPNLDIPGTAVNTYSEKRFEASPLNRVLEQAAPGYDWLLSQFLDTDHTIKFVYHFNSGSEVWKFSVNYDNGTSAPEPELDGTYPINTLYKKVTKDENWQPSDGSAGVTVEFVDKQGHTLLKRQTAHNGANQTYSLDTYYIYDDYGNLVYVLSPEGSAHLVSNNSLVSGYQDVLDDYCYQYHYDQRNRLVWKKIPGKGPEKIKYNNLDMPVLTQDTIMALSNQWLFTKYDALGRVAYTGIYSPAFGFDVEEDFLESIAGATSEVRTSSPTTIGGKSFYYSNFAYPTTTSQMEVLTINYYDDYVDYTVDNGSGTTSLTPPTSVLGTKTTEDASVPTTTQGLPTVSWVKTLGSGSPGMWTTTVTVYDSQGRALQTNSYNRYLQTHDWNRSKLDPFTGRVLETHDTHTKTGQPNLSIADYFTYDHMGRMLSQKQQIGTEPLQLIAENQYDELGQLVRKNVGGETLAEGYTDIENLQVTYDGTVTMDSQDWNWPAQLKTKGKIPPGYDGGIRADILSDESYVRIGLVRNANANLSKDYFDYGITTSYNNNTNSNEVLAVVGGTVVQPGYGTYTAGTTFSVERVGSQIRFSRDGVPFKTVTLTGSGDTFVGKVAMSGPGGSIDNLSLFGTKLDKKLQHVDYAYNIRGWLTDINDIEGGGIGTSSDDLFNFRISYNTVVEGNATNAPLYNGNISQTFWKTKNVDTDVRGYAYSYDCLNRIVGAESYRGTNIGSMDANMETTVENIDYDLNGNIYHLKRWGSNDDGTVNDVWDNLQYGYQGNRLTRITDVPGTSTLGDEGFFAEVYNPNDQYAYDANGNMESDTNKGITAIAYDHLNLPETITVGTQGNQVEYVYDATGAKLSKTVQENVNGTTQISVTQYDGNFVYSDMGNSGTMELQFFSTPEGYVVPVAGTSGSVKGFDTGGGGTSYSSYSYVFQYKDHLGNVRLSYSDADLNGAINPATEIIEENNYYPFGLEHKGYNNVVNGTENNYFNFNGKELEEDLGLGWIDYGARRYMRDLGRWASMDPKASLMPDQSPFVFSFNSPLMFIDPDGELPWPIHIRSFISASSVGGGTFRGDGRGPSTQGSPKATSRVESSFTVDPAKGTVTGLTSRSDATIFYGTGPGGLPPMAETPDPSSSISNVTTYDGKSAISLDFEHSAKDPITPSLVTPDLDVQASLDVIENLGEDGSGLLSVTGRFTGDAFPSTEAFITDQSGETQLLLGAHKEEGGLGKLFGENKRPTFTVNMMINVDKNGNFTGVTQGDKTYTVKEWNQKVKDEFY